MRFFFFLKINLQQVVLKGSLLFLPCVRCPQTYSAKDAEQPTGTVCSVLKSPIDSGGAQIHIAQRFTTRFEECRSPTARSAFSGLEWGTRDLRNWTQEALQGLLFFFPQKRCTDHDNHLTKVHKISEHLKEKWHRWFWQQTNKRFFQLTVSPPRILGGSAIKSFTGRHLVRRKTCTHLRR